MPNGMKNHLDDPKHRQTFLKALGEWAVLTMILSFPGSEVSLFIEWFILISQ
jgi:hypothetical protein